MRSQVRPRLAVAALLVLAGCSAGHRITRLAPGATILDEDRAAYYALPRTLLQVSIDAKRTIVRDKGCYEKLVAEAPPWTGEPAGPTIAAALGVAPKLKIPDPVSVEGAPKLAVLAEPDPDQVFRADLDSSLFVKRKLELAYGPLGVLQSGVSLAKDRTADWAVAGLQAVGGVVKTQSLPPELAPPADASAPPDCDTPRDRLRETVVALQALEPAVDAARIDRATANWLGERLRARIVQILAELVARDELLATIVCLVQPRPGTPTLAVVEHGPKGFRALAGRGCSIPSELAAAADAETKVRFELSVERNADQLVDRFESAGLGRLPADGQEPQGFYYRIPAVARVVVSSVEGGKATPLLLRDVVVAQLGIVAALPRQRAIESQYDVTLDPMTGALVKLVATSEAADPKLLTDVATAVAKEREEQAAAEKAAAAASDELALLERERALLEAELEIRELKKKLGIDGP